MKIDIFPHILTKKYIEGLRKKAKRGTDVSKLASWTLANRALNDIDVRLRLMDRYPDVLQVINVSAPPLETIVAPVDAVELAEIANDEMAELVARYPDKFLAAVACLPMNDIDAALKEADRAINQLYLRGVQIFSNVNGEALDAPKFRPLYEMMARFDLPIWIHPWGTTKMSSSSTWDLSRNPVGTLGWTFETTVAMGCLAQSGVFEDYPNIKFITHHCGGMVPYFERRIGMLGGGLKTSDSFRKFYNDTALYGNTAGLMCGYAFFGADHLLFGTDAPLGRTGDSCGYTLETIRSIERMDITEAEKQSIFGDNALKLLGLPI